MSINKDDLVKIADTAKKGAQSFGSALSPIGHFITKTVNDRNRAYYDSLQRQAAIQNEYKRQAAYLEAQRWYDDISVELSEALKDCASKIGVEPPDNPSDIIDTDDNRRIPISSEGVYHYIAARDRLTLSYREFRPADICSAQRATAFLQKTLNKRLKLGQCAMSMPLNMILNVGISDNPVGDEFRIRVWFVQITPQEIQRLK